MDTEKMQKSDAVDRIENLVKIGLSAGKHIKLEYFGLFPRQAATA